MTVIKDGTGTSKLAKVNTYNKLETDSISETRAMYTARTFGEFFTISSGIVNVTASTEYILLWIQNNNQDKNLYIESHRYSYNGGTTYNRCMAFATYKNPAAPTLHNTDVNITNSNYGSTIVSGATAYKWDGVGNGMTVAITTSTTGQFAAPGLSLILTEGIPILHYGNSMAFSVTPEDTGKASIVVRFFMSDNQQT